MRKKRNKSKKVQLALTYIALWRIEAAPFSDTSDDPTELSSPFPYPYIEVGMVMMINKRGEEPTKRRGTLHLESARTAPSRTSSTSRRQVNPLPKPLSL
jgi:hypothetical protein